MDAQALAAEAEVLSAHYSINTSVNLPRRPGSAAAAATEGKNGVPILSPPVLAFLAVRHVASQTQLCPFGRPDLALDPDPNVSSPESAAQDVVALANKPVVNVPKARDDLPLKRYFISYVRPTTHVLFTSPPPTC